MDSVVAGLVVLKHVGSSRTRDGTFIPCIARILKHWTTSESERESRSVVSDSLWPHGLYSPWNSPGQNTGVGNISLLQGIFPTQGLNPGLHCRQILYQLSHKGSPRILEWVAYLFSRGSSQPRNQTGVSCIAGRFFTSWATGPPGISDSVKYSFEKYLMWTGWIKEKRDPSCRRSQGVPRDHTRNCWGQLWLFMFP